MGGGYEDVTGLVYLVNRYYDPATGQFMSVDPDVGSTGTPYAYAIDNPVSNRDPLGLWTIGICGGWNYFAAFIKGIGGGSEYCLVRTWDTPSGNDDIGWTKTNIFTTGGLGASAGVSVTYQISNGTTLQDLGKWFKNKSVNYAIGGPIGTTATCFECRNMGRKIFGADFGITAELSMQHPFKHLRVIHTFTKLTAS